MPELRIDPSVHRPWQQFAEGFGDLRLDSRMRLAEIVTARVKRAAQRANRSGIGRARRHVLGLERMFANTALDRLDILPAALWLARNVVFAVGGEGDQGRRDECHEQ